MKKVVVAVGALLFSVSAFAQVGPQGYCTAVSAVDQAPEFLVVNGQIRVRKTQENAGFLTTALNDQSLLVCLGNDAGGVVDVISVGGGTMPFPKR